MREAWPKQANRSTFQATEDEGNESRSQRLALVRYAAVDDAASQLACD